MAYGRMISSIVHDVKTVSEVVKEKTHTAPSVRISSNNCRLDCVA